ncbi:NUDIX hydrolase [Candidatus Pacearchaeota archaeon]|nr:NUDIX hydrolase [Candidatus Pacearchaeota archaeon]
MRKAINLAVINDEGILLVKKRKIWILPGGKPEGEESDIDCLHREFKEELSGTKVFIGNYYNSFTGMTPHSKSYLEARIYFGKLNGNLGKPPSEIKKAEFVKNFDKYLLSEITEKIIISLREEGYLW